MSIPPRITRRGGAGSLAGAALRRRARRLRVLLASSEHPYTHSESHGLTMSLQSLRRLAALVAKPGEVADISATAVDLAIAAAGADRAALFAIDPDGAMQPIASRQWSAGLLPSKFQGVKLNSIGAPVLYIDDPPGLSAQTQSDSIQAINALNRIEHSALRDPEKRRRDRANVRRPRRR